MAPATKSAAPAATPQQNRQQQLTMPTKAESCTLRRPFNTNRRSQKASGCRAAGIQRSFKMKRQQFVHAGLTIAVCVAIVFAGRLFSSPRIDDDNEGESKVQK